MSWWRHQRKTEIKLNRESETQAMLEKVMKQIPENAKDIKVKIEWEEHEEGYEDDIEYVIAPNIEVTFTR